MAQEQGLGSIEQFIAALPKAELHLHLEGCVAPDTLWELAIRQNSPLLTEGREALEKTKTSRDFAGFISLFSRISQHLQTPADYELVAYRALRDLAAQNVRYAEITLGAGVILRKGQDLRAVFSGAEAGAQRASEECGIRVQWILDAVRHWGTEPAWPVVRTAASLQERGVVAFGIGGDEARGPASQFREIYNFARSEGLHAHAHAGELAGPESVWSALQDLGAERIGHGLTAVRDPRLIDYLANEQIPVEICLTSNQCTGGITDLTEHPLRRYFDRGMHVSLHSDDPALFGTNINREYLLAHQIFGFSRDELRRMAIRSFEAAFLPVEDRQRYFTAVTETERV